MKLLVVNPNTSASMTARIGAAARAAAAAGTEIVAVNPESGPASIEGYFDEAFAVPIDTGVASATTVGAAHGLERAINPSPRRVVAPPRARSFKTMGHRVEIGELRSQHGGEFLAPERLVASIPGLAVYESYFNGGAFGDGGAGQR
jgi:Asp/Glu/Hydantoin racemase